MLTRTYTATMIGLQAILIEVEVDSIRGKPNLIFIGLPDKTVDEAKERITTALLNCGIRIRAKRTIVNLAPADIRKTESSLELAIAIAIVKMYGDITYGCDDTIFFGELSLDGSIKPMRGALPLILQAKKLGFSKVVFPHHNINEVRHVEGITLHPIKHFQELLDFAKKQQPLTQLQPTPFTQSELNYSGITLNDVKGQLLAKRALEIAAAGGHNVLLIGPPGAGKSMMAQAMRSILPDLSHEEAIEITSIYSVVGKNKHALIRERPYRSPHHSTSQVGLIGGGSKIKPGEISLAHRGVLFLDEFPEFNRASLEALRQPLENGLVTITRAAGTIEFPARFTLIAAANPCPCGYAGSKITQCKCSPSAIQKYQQRLSGPILDRIDLWVRVREVPLGKLAKAKDQSNDATLQITKQKIQQAKQRQQQRFKNTQYLQTSELSSKDISKLCKISTEAFQMLLEASEKLHVSARSYFKLLKVGRTIADLEDSEEVMREHIAEALRYRSSLFAT